MTLFFRNFKTKENEQSFFSENSSLYGTTCTFKTPFAEKLSRPLKTKEYKYRWIINHVESFSN